MGVAQRPGCGDGGVLPAERPGGGVARIGELTGRPILRLGEQAGIQGGEVGLAI